MSEMPVCEAYMRLVDLADARDLPAAWRPGAVESFDIDGTWRATVNRGREEQQGIPAFHILVERKGWPVGLLHPRGGTMVAGAEDALIAAVEAALPPPPEKE